MSSVFLTTVPAKKTQEQKKITRIAKRVAKRVRDIQKPSECVVRTYVKE